LWILALLATGFAAAARRVSFSTSLSCVAGIWFAYVLLKMFGAVIFG